MIAGCCLLAVASGCSFHRTEHGFILRSGQWSLERNSERPEPAAAAASEKPELLPWRSRLKGYRLGSRILHGRESAETTATPPTNLGGVQPPGGRPADSASNRPDLVAD